MKKIACILLSLALPLMLAAQDNKTPEEREKEFYEALEKQIDNLTNLLDLEDWQVFYVDSILTHDYLALSKEMEGLSQSKVTNPDLFYAVQDKWMEQIHNSLHGVFDERQWAKYLKNGAAREKRARDKRAKKQ